MNILFLAASPNPSYGGIERVTSLLTRHISNTFTDVHLFGLFIHQSEEHYSQYDDICYLLSDDLKQMNSILEFIQTNMIDIIVNPFVSHTWIKPLFKVLYTTGNIKVISVLHNKPTAFEQIKHFHRKINIPQAIETPLFALYKSILRFRLKSLTRFHVRYSDKYVLLSKCYIPAFVNYNKLSNKLSDKIYSINNPNTFENCTETSICQKENLLLFVGRIDNTQKRLDKLLVIWSKIQNEHLTWKLEIVGDGEDLSYIKELAKELKLERISFEGHKTDPSNYYKRAKVFLMTSDYEGWAMTVVEAQSYGAVPVAFNTYEALQEIISSERKNGIIVQDRHDIEGYNKAVEDVFDNYPEYFENCINSVDKYSIDIIARNWYDLFNNLH